jgi:nucleotide-binding universal stress UspA family protein
VSKINGKGGGASPESEEVDMPGIIVGVDGSSHSRKALGQAITEAVVHHAPLTVLVVHQAVVDVYGLPSEYPGDAAMTEKAREAAQAEVDQMLAAAATRPESVTVKAVHGLPVDELVNASSDADMLVLGRHGRGDFALLVRGSTATQVANHAHCAVLIVPPAEDA